MRPARTYPEQRDDVRLLVIDPAAPEGARAARDAHAGAARAAGARRSAGGQRRRHPARFAARNRRGRASRRGAPDRRARRLARGGWHRPVRLSAALLPRFAAVLFGAGDWHTRTEDRPPPPELAEGARLRFGALRATVGRHATLSPRLVELRFDGDGDALWAALYKEGRPVQYAHLAHDLPLWAVQTVYATRPWAFEMPSAGRPLSWEILLALRRRGVRWASLTHAAGLSATGDPAIDAALPLPEAFDIPAATARAVAETRARNGRVVAVGTTVVRALEGAAQQTRRHRPRRPRRDRPAHHARLPPARRRRHPLGRPRRAREPLPAPGRVRGRGPAGGRRRASRARRLPDPRARRCDAGPARRAGRAAAHRDRRRGGARVGCGRDAGDVHGIGGARRGAARFAAPAARALARRHRRLDRGARAGGRDRDTDGARIHAYLHRKEGDLGQRPLLVPAGGTRAVRGEPRRRMVRPRPRSSRPQRRKHPDSGRAQRRALALCRPFLRLRVPRRDPIV